MTEETKIDPATIRIKKPKTEVSNNITLTKFTADGDTLMTKKIELVDGKLQKTSAPQLASGSAERMVIKKLSDIENIINDLEPNQCISTGVFDLEECDITTTAKLTERAIASGFRPRTKKHMEQPESGVVLLDFDPSPFMPGHLKISGPEQLMEKLQEVIPELNGIGWTATTSCSSGISASDGSVETPDSGGLHVYFNTKFILPTNLQTLLRTRLWNTGMGFIALAKNGAMLERTLLDLSVLSPERLIFEARPALGEGLEQSPRQWTHTEGDALTTIPTVTEEENALAEENVALAKQDPELLAKQREINEEYCRKLVPTLMNRFSINEEEAKTRAAIHKGAFSDTTEIVPDSQVPELIEVRGEWLKPSEICERWEELDGVSIPDPIEGREYGESTAIIYGNGGSPVVHSFAHGVSRLYSVVQFEVLDQEMEVVTGSQPASSLEPNSTPKIAPKVATTIPLDKSPTDCHDAINRPKPLRVESFPDTVSLKSGDNKPVATIANTRVLLKHYGVICRYNAISKCEELMIPGLSTSTDNRDNSTLAHIFNLCTLNGISKGDVPGFPLLLIPTSTILPPITSPLSAGTRSTGCSSFTAH